MGVVLLILMFVWTIMVGLLIVLMEKCQISPEVIAIQRWGVENVGFAQRFIRLPDKPDK